MKETNLFYKNSIAVSALFILGNSVITMPKKDADEYTFLGFLLACLCGILALFLLNPLANFLIAEKSTKTLKIFKIFILAILAVSSLFFSAGTFKDFTSFISQIILPDISGAIIILTFLLAVLFFAFKCQEKVLKFALLCYTFSIVIIIFFFFITFKNFNMRNIFIFKLPNANELANSILPYLKNSVLPILILPFYRVFVFKNKLSSAYYKGTVSGFILLGLCILSSVLLFSPQLAGKLDYPYAAAISTITVGKLFTRMDGFSYFIYFSAAITKITLCNFVSFTSLKNIQKLLNN